MNALRPTNASRSRAGLWLLTGLMTAAPSALLGGCKSTYYVEYLAGDWTGTASAQGAQIPMSASFEWDEEKAKDEKSAFGGEIDVDGYLYSVNGVTSDKESADIHLTPQDPNRGEGDLKGVALNEDEDAITGSLELNVCPPGTNQDPAICVLSGDFELDLEE